VKSSVTSVSNSPLPLVQVINLARRPDRRQSVTADFKGLGIPLLFVEAVDGLGMIEAPIPGLSNTEKACWQSHLIAMRNLLNSENDYTLVLEDDAYPAEEFSQTALGVLVELARNQNLDVLQLGFIEHLYHWYKPQGLTDLLMALKQKRLAKDPETGIRFVRNEFRAGAHAYLISKRGAKILASCVETPPMLPFDGFLEVLSKQGGRASGLQMARLSSSMIQQRSRLAAKTEVDSDVAGRNGE